MPAVYAGQYGPEGMNFPDGRPARHALIEVRKLDGTLASLYANPQKTIAAPNPAETDDYGNLTFHATPGDYNLAVNGALIPVVVPIHPSDPGLGIDVGGGYVHHQTTGVYVVQILHALPWNPGGIICLENNGDMIDYDRVVYPQLGIVEVYFQVLFAGTIYVS